MAFERPSFGIIGISLGSSTHPNIKHECAYFTCVNTSIRDANVQQLQFILPTGCGKEGFQQHMLLDKAKRPLRDCALQMAKKNRRTTLKRSDADGGDITFTNDVILIHAAVTSPEQPKHCCKALPMGAPFAVYNIVPTVHEVTVKDVKKTLTNVDLVFSHGHMDVLHGINDSFLDMIPAAPWLC